MVAVRGLTRWSCCEAEVGCGSDPSADARRTSETVSQAFR